MVALENPHTHLAFLYKSLDYYFFHLFLMFSILTQDIDAKNHFMALLLGRAFRLNLKMSPTGYCQGRDDHFSQNHRVAKVGKDFKDQVQPQPDHTTLTLTTFC